jgi:hypothetical protein
MNDFTDSASLFHSSMRRFAIVNVHDPKPGGHFLIHEGEQVKRQ